MKGQKMLKVCGILMIIGAAFSLAILLLAIIGGTILLEGSGSVFILALALLVVSSLGAILQLAAGIVGVKAANMPSVAKIKASVILGILVVLLALYNNIYSLVTSPIDVTAIVSLVLGLIVPVLYVVGVIQYKNALLELLGGDGE